MVRDDLDGCMTSELVESARRVQVSRKINKDRKRSRPQHPTGFEPGLNTEKNEITGAFDHPIPEDQYKDTFSGLLEEWGFDPAQFDIEDDRVEVRTWDAHYGVERDPVKFWYYKARVIRKRRTTDVSDLVRRIRRRKPIKPRSYEGDRSFVVLNADWQLGKRDGGGTASTIEAVKVAIPRIRERYTNLRKEGHKIDDLIVANMGDLVEGCKGHYPMQTFNVELSRREQRRLGRELLTEEILGWADDFERVLILGVPGNHGEERNDDGKMYTNLGDNDDIALVEEVAEAFDLALKAGSSRYDHLSFMIPDNELSFTIDVHGTVVGFTHGHVGNARTRAGKSLNHTKLWDWWYGQTMGRQAVADADLLLSGHYHYLSVIVQGGRSAIQAPSLDGGSGWFVDTQGLQSMASIATLLVGGGTDEGRKPGWEALDILS